MVSIRRVAPSSEANGAEVVFEMVFAAEIKQPIIVDYNAILISKFGGYLLYIIYSKL